MAAVLLLVSLLAAAACLAVAWAGRVVIARIVNLVVNEIGINDASAGRPTLSICGDGALVNASRLDPVLSLAGMMARMAIKTMNKKHRYCR